MSYPGQLPGIGDPGYYVPSIFPGDLNPGLPTGFPNVVYLPPGTVTVPGATPYTPQPTAPSDQPLPDPGEEEQPTPAGTPNPGYNNPLIPTPGEPDTPDVPGEGPPEQPDYPGPPVLFLPGPPVIFEEGPPPPPGSYTTGAVPRSQRGRGYGFPSPFPTLPAPEPPRSPDDDETDRERPPLFPPDEPANDTSIRRPPVQQVEPVRVPDPAGVRAPFPQPPTLPRVPIPPTVTVPTQEPPTWPKPDVFAPAAPPMTIPSAVPTATPSQPSAATSSQPASASAPLFSILPLLGALLNLPGLRAGAAPAASSMPLPFTGTGSLPSTSPLPSPIASPGLTPSVGAGVESASQGQSCETPGQTRQRRQDKRDNCARFITVVVPKHRRRVCAAEAGKLIGRKLGRKVGSVVGKAIRGQLKKHGVNLAKLKPRRKRIPRSIDVGGGFGIAIPRGPP